MNPERERWRAALTPDPHTLRRDQLLRKDVWVTIDRLEKRLVYSDEIWDSALRKDLTNLRAMLSTLLPDDPPVHVCPKVNCGIRYRSERKLAEHVYYVHDGPTPAHLRDDVLRAV